MLATSAAFDRAATHEELVREKRGRIVDASTGRGQPDVAVVGLWDTSYANLHSQGYGCVFEKVVRTDADGNYVLPEVSSDLAAFSQRSATYGWRIVVFEEGFLRKGDREKFGSKQGYAASLGFQVGFEWQGGFLPEVRHVGDFVDVAPIVVERSDGLAPADELTYLGRTRQAILCPSATAGVGASSLTPILQAIAARARVLVCELPQDRELSGESASEAAQLIGGKAVYASMQRAGEPSMPPWHAIAAKALCDAARTADETR